MYCSREWRLEEQWHWGYARDLMGNGVEDLKEKTGGVLSLKLHGCGPSQSGSSWPAGSSGGVRVWILVWAVQPALEAGLDGPWPWILYPC